MGEEGEGKGEGGEVEVCLLILIPHIAEHTLVANGRILEKILF